MSAGIVFGAMEAREWEIAKKIIATFSWTSTDLEKKLGVRTELRSS